ncbi:MAG TPA: FAD:protein FMN transferase [Kiritimatiellia bacterium]|nr:FAD:protein FMN transferase [Kiritimatiellia bacterium]
MKLIQPRRFYPIKTIWVLAVLAALFVYTTQRDRPPQLWRWSGEIFGSTYSVQIVDKNLNERKLAVLHEDIEAFLDDMNGELSTWLPDSPLSRFNADTSLSPITVTPRIAELAALCDELSRASGGAFDATFGPLFDAWGFGRTGPKRVPDAETVADARARCGYTLLTIISSNQLQKAHPGLHLVFNAVAPGYAAQQVAERLRARGFTNLYVDVGGETVVRGRNLRGQPWRIGIERPDYNIEPGDQIETVLAVTDVAVATSGDYRNFVLGEDGVHYSHIFDPRTGRPAMNRVASVTVVANNGAWADALATTLFVMGPEEGLPWLQENTDAEALFLMRENGGGYREVASPGLTARTGYMRRL